MDILGLFRCGSGHPITDSTCITVDTWIKKINKSIRKQIKQMNLITLYKNKKQKKNWQCRVTKATLAVSGYPALLLNMGVDKSELVCMDISGPLLTHEGMDIYILGDRYRV